VNLLRFPRRIIAKTQDTDDRRTISRLCQPQGLSAYAPTGLNDLRQPSGSLGPADLPAATGHRRAPLGAAKQLSLLSRVARVPCPRRTLANSPEPISQRRVSLRWDPSTSGASARGTERCCVRLHRTMGPLCSLMSQLLPLLPAGPAGRLSPGGLWVPKGALARGAYRVSGAKGQLGAYGGVCRPRP
jgi:hypothetical protein